ncbi:hypothetical protein L596_019851 [Steinernema carpocapsae]|uniref:DUF19 domain-containing protein n=1 Tax=Steinernema carpocapsae TaxID=34508 RepID=A0A4U5MRY6_STECR|nr:hypothetical protein L596_019851 [Steinernema carpocapsae]
MQLNFKIAAVLNVLWCLVSATTPPDPCLLKCKDNYMNEMQTIVHDTSGEWSIELVTPLQSVLRATSKNAGAKNGVRRENSDDVVAKVGDICQTNRVYLTCLGQCHESPARNALFIGQKSWTTICNAYGNDPDFTSTILPCWSEHGDEISNKCHIHAQMVQNSVVDLLQNGIHSIEDNLSDLCRTITIYDKCYIWQNDQFCGEKAWEFLLQLNERSSQ